jgi:hypothetical protein
MAITDALARIRMALPAAKRDKEYPVATRTALTAKGQRVTVSRWCAACGARISDKHVVGCVNDDGL